MMHDRESFLNAVAMVSFIISLANYSENLDQSSAQDMLNKVVGDIHQHLKEQDAKIDKIMDILEGGRIDER